MLIGFGLITAVTLLTIPKRTPGNADIVHD